jgi:hypothetical protein
MNRSLRILILVAAVPTALSGCFLFGATTKRRRARKTAAMDASGAPLKTPSKHPGVAVAND